MEACCLEKGVDITPYGSWTHESKETSRGAEPDECYVLGDDAEPTRCDLAIEVVWTHGGVDKLDIYRKLGMGEVWIWKSNRLSLHRLRGDRYEPRDAASRFIGRPRRRTSACSAAFRVCSRRCSLRITIPLPSVVITRSWLGLSSTGGCSA